MQQPSPQKDKQRKQIDPLCDIMHCWGGVVGTVYVSPQQYISTTTEDGIKSTELLKSTPQNALQEYIGKGNNKI